MREANSNTFVSALTAVSLLSFFALLGFLRLLTLNAQPIAEGTGWLRMISYLLVFLSCLPFYIKKRSQTRAVWLAFSLAMALVVCLCLSLFLQWFMVVDHI